MTDTTSTINDITASLQALADDIQAERAHGDMLRRKLRQAHNDFELERLSNSVLRRKVNESRKAIVELQVKCTEELKKRDERIAELEAMLADGAWILSDIQR